MELSKEHEALTGVKFNRLVHAAILKLLYDDSGGNWIAVAVAVEHGEITIDHSSMANSVQTIRRLRDLARGKKEPSV